MSFMLMELSVSADLISNDPLNITDEPYDQSIVTIEIEKTAPEVKNTRYGMGYEQRMKNARRHPGIDRVDNARRTERPSRPERPERFFRPERPQRPERPNRPGR